MKFFFLLLIILPFLYSCSFDNKTGIWTGEEKKITKEKVNSVLEPVFKKNGDKLFEKEFSTSKKILLGKKFIIKNWTQQYQNNSNHIKRSYFSNLGNYEKFSKISRYQVNKNILYKDQKLFFSDKKGNIGVFSIFS